MTIDRLTRERLYKDERLFNDLLPFAKYDEEQGLFIHSDASLWSLWELKPRWFVTLSDAEAFEISSRVQEMMDALDHTISMQISWITTFDVEGLLQLCQSEYPAHGPAGWMARRWIRNLRKEARSKSLHRRPRMLRLVIAFRFQPPWVARGLLEQLQRTIQLLLHGKVEVTVDQRRAEYLQYASNFRGLVEGTIGRLNDLGLSPRHIDGQSLINLIYPLLNRRSVKSGKFRRGRGTATPVPVYDPEQLLANQLSETVAEHPRGGIIKKDGRIFRTVSMVHSPKRCMPLMIIPFQSMPYENILSVTLSRDPREKQLQRLDRLDALFGRRERTGSGRSNQQVLHQISAIRAAREELYSGRSGLVRVGVHQTFICQNEEEAMRATSEAIATFPQLNGARGMVHEISDLGVLLNSLPGCYDPATDGAGWTNVMQSSRAVRLLPLFGNWRGSQNPLFVLPNLWNRELIGFDLYDSNVAPNVLISGVSGAGKSYLLCFMIITMNRGHYATTIDGRRVERPPITFVFDKGMQGQPCGFEKVAKLFGGRIYEATPSRAPAMNFLARLGRTAPDGTNEDYRDLLDMSADVICDMASEGEKTPDRLDRAVVYDSLLESHRIYRSGQMRREFILSDVVAMLRAPQKVNEDDDTCSRRQRMSVLISDYYGDGVYARFFDRPGALKLEQRFIVFDLKSLSRNPDLQRVFLKIAMMWADEVMNDPKELDCRKVLVFDEAHDLIGKTSAKAIETAFRLYRKRKGIVIAASQSGEDFYVGEGGQAIVQNSPHKIFLRQDASKFHYTAKAFNLSEQQASVILRLKTVKGVESQFYMLSDIGEGPLCLPLEPAHYWASTNNGDDNQLFAELLARCEGNFWRALEEAVRIAPYGATELASRARGNGVAAENDSNVVNTVHAMMNEVV
jgi:conjugal transfer ATP-binding protein TraC